MGQPPPFWKEGDELNVTYKNVTVTVTGDVLDVYVTTPTATVGNQISLLTGSVVGGSNAPKS